MAPVAFAFVVRFSSEDAIFKAENLCSGKTDAMSAWKCAKEDTNCGRMEAEFQLEKASYISHIDIGNCGSAFIEILVGNSMWPQEKPFLTLLPSAMLMTPAECKQWTKTHTVRMLNHNSFSKQALGSQWDRIRVTCRQPFRSDKQFGLSFIRITSVEGEPPSSPPGGVSGKTATSGKPPDDADDADDDDGIMRLKKASGLMGCLRSLEKESPESPLNRAGKMLQAALDNRSSTTPRIKPGYKRSLCESSPEFASSPESPYSKRNWRLPSDVTNLKTKKQERTWSLAGDIRDEVELFLEDIDFTKIDLDSVMFKDLKSQMEAQRGCSLTSLEKKVFLQMMKAAIEKLQPASNDSDSDLEDVLELSTNKCNTSPNLQIYKRLSGAKKKFRESTAKSTSEEKSPSTKNQSQSPDLISTVSISEHKSHRSKKQQILPDDIFEVDIPSSSSRFLEDDTEELPSMLDSSADKPAKQELFHCGDYELLPSSAKKTSSESLVECPICSMFFPSTRIEIHAALCNNETSVPQNNATLEDDLIPCPICSIFFPLAQIEQHADVCVETSRCNHGSNQMGRKVVSSLN